MKAPPARNNTTALSSTMLAFAFAFFGFTANTLETWFPSWEAKPGKEVPVTVRLPARYFRITMLRNEFHYLSTTSSMCPHLVPRGTQLKRGSECAGLVKAFETSRRTVKPFRLVGIFVFYFVTGLLLSLFMRTRSKGRARLLRSQLTLFALLVFMFFLTKAILLLTSLTALVLPVVALPLLGSYFFRRQVALVIVLVSALTTSSLVNYDIEIFLVFFASGITVMGTRLPRHRAWLQLRGGAIASWVAVISVLITTLLFSGTLDIHDDLTEHFDPRYSLWLAALFGGLGSGFLSWALTPLMGLMVGEVSRSTLLDLQDLDQRLLKRIRDRAPGTWEHSRAMANLAEAGANAIGGNALLARLGAYYHDMGKTITPEYFIENQAGGPNPHDDLTPIESAHKIFKHVTEGTRLLRNEGLPEDVVEFCYSHHGTSVLEYFWHKNMAAGNPDNLTEKDFQYPGYKPTTRETGILMLVDAIEAAARTVDNPEKTVFQNLVQNIIFSKLSQGQLDETGLTLSDIRTISRQIIDTLVNMYHARIKYPWQSGDTSTSLRLPPPKIENGESKPTLDISTQVSAENGGETRKRPSHAPERVEEQPPSPVDVTPAPGREKTSETEPEAAPKHAPAQGDQQQTPKQDNLRNTPAHGIPTQQPRKAEKGKVESASQTPQAPASPIHVIGNETPKTIPEQSSDATLKRIKRDTLGPNQKTGSDNTAPKKTK